MLKPTDLFTDVQIRLSTITCPSCRTRGLDLRIRCDVDLTDCLYLAICDACAAEYWIDRDSAPADLDDDQVCMACGSPHCSLTLSCDAATHRCVYALSYTPCIG